MSRPIAAPDATRADGHGGRAPDLSVIIVGWNVRELTMRCIDVLRARADDVSLEIILVDNASHDDTAPAVRARFPDVLVLETGGNIGFARANNLGLRHATGRHVLFLNPDTEVGERTLPVCVQALDGDASIGVVGCRLVHPDGRIQFECARHAYRLRHLLAELLYLHMLLPRSRWFGHQLMGYWDHLDSRDVEAISGAFVMVRRGVAQSIGGFPDDVFMYFDDLAFCLRVRRAGWRIRYVADVQTMHHANQSTRQRRDARWDLLECEYKCRLIRESGGIVAAGAARAVFGVRSVIRMAATLASFALPGGRRLRARYPQALHLQRHWLQLRWSMSRRSVTHLIPGHGGGHGDAEQSAAAGASPERQESA